MAGLSDRSERVVLFLLISEGRSTKNRQFTTNRKRQNMTRNQPDQRKGSMDGNWATTAAMPEGRRRQAVWERAQQWNGLCTSNMIISISDVLQPSHCNNFASAHLNSYKVPLT